MTATPRVRAPELPQNYLWLNIDQPLSLQALKGRVVILDFWTYCCINCLHILPDLKYLEQKYAKNLTIIGVHCAKFEQEKDIEQIRQAILRYDIEHPVVVDQDFHIWQQYAVRAWPTLIIIDPKGYVIGSVVGEGKRELLDQWISEIIHQFQQQEKISFQTLTFNLEKQRESFPRPLSFPGKILAVKNNLLIADSGHHRIVHASTDGEILQIIGTGKPGLQDGTFTEAQFFSPQGMAFDENKQLLYVADTENHSLRRINLKDKTVETIAGTGEQNRNIYPQGGVGLVIALNSPWDVELMGDRLWIAMAGSHQIWQMTLTSGLLQTYAGTGREFGLDGAIATATFAQPSGITSDGQELLIADSEISSIRGVGITENAQVRTICGSGELFGFGDLDGTGSGVRLQHCLGVDYAAGGLWVADTYNHKIKLVDIQTGECRTVVGNGTAGFEDGQGTRARFWEPSGLSVAGDRLYIADTNNHQIRSVVLETLEVKTLEFPGLCGPNVCLPI